MTERAREKVVADELVLAEEALRAAETLQRAALVRSALSRVYFAALHFSRALLASAGLEAKSHRGMKSLLWVNFVQPAKLEPEYQQLIARLETWREEADYSLGFVADPTLLATEMDAARRLRARVHELLRAAGFTP
ncbi:MAG: HEPN domain-containing protein [Myxococcales bacterium]|nr:HEPN domain-containing protein [Myxococcales bacterium]